MARINQNTNLASEFFVASQLFRLGFTVTITLGHTKEIDIIAIQNGRVITIDVKGLKNKTNWPLKPKAIKANHFYILVSYGYRFQDLKAQPETFIIPANKISKLLGKWSGRPEVSAVGYSKIRNGKYREAWRLLQTGMR